MELWEFRVRNILAREGAPWLLEGFSDRAQSMALTQKLIYCAEKGWRQKFFKELEPHCGELEREHLGNYACEPFLSSTS